MPTNSPESMMMTSDNAPELKICWEIKLNRIKARGEFTHRPQQEMND